LALVLIVRYCNQLYPRYYLDKSQLLIASR